MSVFHFSRRVTYADCTVGNHIYYGRYLELLEEARGEFFRHLGVPLLELQNQDTTFPVVECRLRYKWPARYDDVLQIDLWITVAQGVRVNFAYAVHNQDGALILEGETFHACATIEGKPKRLPASLPSQLAAYVQNPGKAIK